MTDSFMTNSFKIAFRGLSLAAVLLAGSCAGPDHNPGGTFEDGGTNHPITVEPSYKSLKLSFAAGGLSNTDAAMLEAFVHDYGAHGNGSIAVSAPANEDSRGAVTWFADRINALGISRDHILVSTHEAAAGDNKVEIDYVAYQAHADRCGDWSEDLAYTMENTTPRNFGCSFQHNIAAQVADPRDLIAPRPMDGSDAVRRATMVTNYEQGNVTQANKKTADSQVEQSAPGSDVGR
jgi:pilus assembly protein CpaD